jgi:alkanesulfonate monooxygenase SsuD/methylene tetrahydromethanopterin reductase-like flavin-dependent oxidoreductase (luciferase family)
MHVGKGIQCQNFGDPRDDKKIFLHEVALAEQASKLGFQSLWTAEHHFKGYHLCPNVLQLLTYLAGRTSDVLLGSMVVVLPWHDPVRIAEEVSAPGPPQ